VDPARLEHRLHVLSAVAAIFCDEFAATRAQAADSVALERRLAPVLDRLALDEFLELTAPQLAVKFNCGRRHLNRLFHHYSGLSISALRVEVRLVKAVSLLRDPTVKVVEVAGQCGFSHLGYFNACFRRRFGVTPGQWRENLVDMKASSSRGIDTSPECRLHANGLCPWSPTMPANSRGSVARESKVTVAVCSATFARLKPNDGSGCRDEPSPGIPSAPAASEKATGIVDPSQPLSPFSGNDHATKGRDGAARSDQSPASYTATESTTTQAACARL